MSTNRNLWISGSDGIIYFTDYNTARVSNVLREFIDANPEIYDDVLEIKNFNSKTLHLVLWWMTNHQNDSDIHSCDHNVTIDAWDRDFLNTSCSDLVSIIKASNFLDIKKLLIQAINTLANRVNEKLLDSNRVEKIRKLFNFESRPEEESVRLILNAIQLLNIENNKEKCSTSIVYIPPRKVELNAEDSNETNRMHEAMKEHEQYITLMYYSGLWGP